MAHSSPNNQLRADPAPVIPESQPRMYNTATVLRMAGDAGYGRNRAAWTVSMQPKLKQLGMGICYGEKGNPIYYTETEARQLLLWLVYRSYLVDNGGNPRAHFTVDDLKDFFAAPFGSMGAAGDHIFSIVDAIMQEGDTE